MMAKKISDHIYSNGLMGQLKESLDKLDTNNEGKIPGDGLLLALKQLRIPIPVAELERYIRQVPKDNFGKVNYQKLLLSFENSKQKLPLKAIGLRLVVFLKQNNLTAKSLIEKLLSTKKQQSDPKQQKQINFISVTFFSKFIKAKVDKKRTLDEIKEYVRQVDMDRDGLIGESDLEAFLGRVNFQEFFEGMSLGSRTGSVMSAEKTSHLHKKSISNSEFKMNSRSGHGYLNSSVGGPRTMSFLSENESASTKMFPSQKMQGD